MTAKLPTYVINLERSVDRRIFMEVHLSEFPELECQFIPAVDGKLLTPEELAEKYDEHKTTQLLGRALNTGEIGCALSHIGCYRKLLVERKQFALVLEDDILISSFLPQILPSLFQWLDTDQPRVVLLTPMRRYWLFPKKTIGFHYSLHKRCKMTVSAAGYLINASAADIMARRLFTVHTVADHWQYFAEKLGLDVRVLIPHCVSFRPCSRTDSTIGGSRHYGRREKKLFRKLKNIWYRPLEHLGLIRFGKRLW